jgi:hypothetical protein
MLLPLLLIFSDIFVNRFHRQFFSCIFIPHSVLQDHHYQITGKSLKSLNEKIILVKIFWLKILNLNAFPSNNFTQTYVTLLKFSYFLKVCYRPIFNKLTCKGYFYFRSSQSAIVDGMYLKVSKYGLRNKMITQFHDNLSLGSEVIRGD